MSKAHEVITERILQMMETGLCPWRRPWKSLKAAGLTPKNHNGREYRGANFFLLGMLHYELPIFLTFKQAKDLGGQVMKGAKGFPVIFWKLLDATAANAESPDQIGRKIPMARIYTVFNVSQVEGLALPKWALDKLPLPSPAFDPIEEAEALVQAMPNPPTLYHGADSAFYQPSSDTVHLPDRKWFDDAEGYYETLFHELGHSTGHQTRLNRKGLTAPTYFGSHDYSQEELVAELTAAFLSCETGLDATRLENMAAYCQGWFERLKKEPKLFLTASAQAQKAADFILNKKAFAETQGEAA